MKSILCIIPARSGSRGLKNKNIKLLNKLPLIMYPYLIAKKSKLISDICVTSDSKKYLNIFDKKDVIKILRPKKIATSNSSVSDTILHAISKIDKSYDYIILLEPTSPLTSPVEIDKALKFLINKKKGDTLVSVVSNPKFLSVFRVKINNNFRYIKNSKLKKNLNRQNFKPEYYFSGNFYITKTSSFKKMKSFLTKKTFCFPIKKSIHTDIDNIYDFIYAEALLKNRLYKF